MRGRMAKVLAAETSGRDERQMLAGFSCTTTPAHNHYECRAARNALEFDCKAGRHRRGKRDGKMATRLREFEKELQSHALSPAGVSPSFAVQCPRACLPCLLPRDVLGAVAMVACVQRRRRRQTPAATRHALHSHLVICDLLLLPLSLPFFRCSCFSYTVNMMGFLVRSLAIRSLSLSFLRSASFPLPVSLSLCL